MIVVTGGAGFIGSNLVAGLEAAGAGDLVVCDLPGDAGDPEEKILNLAGRKLAGLVEPGNLLAFLEGNGPKMEAVFHLGAVSSTTETDVDLILDTNFRLSIDIWSLCARHQIPLIYASSAATYGDGSGGFDDNGSPDALARLRPLNVYGWSKHLFDRWVVRQTAEGAPIPPQWAGLKFFNVYGPNEYHKGGQISVPLKNFREIEADGEAMLFKSHHPDYADGGQMRDFVWVGDCVNVMLWLKQNPQVSGLFNVGTGKARSFADLAKSVFAALNRRPNIRYVDTPEAIRARYQYFTEAPMDRMRQAGYQVTFTGLEDGVARYVQDYLATSHPHL